MSETIAERPVLLRPRHLLAATFAIIGATALATWRVQEIIYEVRRNVQTVGTKVSVLSGRVTGLELQQARTNGFMASAQRANVGRAAREAQRKELCSNAKVNLPPWACFGLLSDEEIATLRGEG